MNGLSRTTRALLDKGRGGEPLPADRRSRMKRAVFAQLAAASIAGTTSTASAWTAWGAFAAKAIGVVALAGAVTGVVQATQSRPEPQVVAAPATGRPSAPQKMAPRAAAPVDTQPRAAAAVSSAAPVVEATVPADEGRRAAPAGATVRVTPALQGERAATAAPPAPPAPASPDRLSRLAEEVSLLRSADAALRTGDAERTLALLDELDATVPQGNLLPERAADRIFALCVTGRTEEARRRARAFLASDPSGPLAARVRASCGEP